MERPIIFEVELVSFMGALNQLCPDALANRKRERDEPDN